jgi:hypothetical protein
MNTANIIYQIRIELAIRKKDKSNFGGTSIKNVKVKA